MTKLHDSSSKGSLRTLRCLAVLAMPPLEKSAWQLLVSNLSHVLEQLVPGVMNILRILLLYYKSM